MYRYSKSQKLDFLIPLIILMGLTFLFHETSLDERLASLFYSKTEFWVYRNNFFLEKVLHKGGVIFGIVANVALIFWLGYIWKKPLLKLQRDYLMFVLTSALLTIGAIALVKRWTTVPCPWGVVEFGGKSVAPHLWEIFSSKIADGHCFPAGHSSAGYSFLSLYYGHLLIYGKRNFLTLIPGLFIGIIFGVTQQMRGAHFISHDFATIFVSILISWFTYILYSIYNKVNEI